MVLGVLKKKLTPELDLDGNIVIWHKNSGAPVERLSGHTPRCNAVTWNPTDPCMLASCGDDGKIKM